MKTLIGLAILICLGLWACGPKQIPCPKADGAAPDAVEGDAQVTCYE